MPETFNPFVFCDALYRSLDGAIVMHNARGRYDYNAICAWAWANPDQVKPMPVDLEALKSDLCARVETRLQELLYQGFPFDGQTYPADIQAQTAAIDAGQDYQETGDISVLGAFCKANTWVAMSPEKFGEFRATGRRFVRGLFARVWQLKHEEIKNATTPEEARDYYDVWLVG